MKNLFTKVVPFTLATVLMVSTSAFAATNATIDGGTLNFGTSVDEALLTEGTSGGSKLSNAQFGTTVEMDIKTDASLGSLPFSEFIRLDDDRATNAGWEVLVSAEDLVATVPDLTNTTDINPTVTITIPVNTVMQWKANTITALAGSLTTGITSTNSFQDMQNAGSNHVLKALAGEGAGAYTTKVDYKVNFPNFLPATSTVVPSNLDNSSLDGKTVTNLSSFEGEYKTTVTYAINQTP